MSVGIEPFGFALAHPGILVDSETFQGAPGLGAASSYNVASSGELQVVSPSVHDTQSAPCWLVITADHRFAFVTNTASGSVSSYQIAADGTLTLLNAGAASPGRTRAAMTRGSFEFGLARCGQGQTRPAWTAPALS